MSGAKESEAALCQRAAAGDRSAFAALVRSHQSGVRNQLRRLTHGDFALADDLAQDCFVQAWTHLAEFKGQSRFASWLYRIAYNRFLMHVRNHPATVSLADDEQGEEVAQALGHDGSMRLDVETALARLPQAERVALIHCYHLDLSHEEAAQVLNLPLGTVKSQVLRGKARLRDLLAAWAPEKTS